MTAAPGLRVGTRALFGHPPALTVLFLTQMWAEFSYFGLQALLVYYMTQQLGYTQAHASLIYGAYGAAAFFSPFFGGIVADRWLGRTRSVVLGGLLMMAGHFAMASASLLFPALALVAIGNGLFVPPLAVQVGDLYADDDPRKAGAFSAYYMGINLGGLLAPLVCGTLGETLGWHWGFAAAGVGMAVGLSVYLGFARLLPGDTTPSRSRVTYVDRLPADHEALRLLAALVGVVILFRIAYEQSGNVIALWVMDQTDRSADLFGTTLIIPATWFQAVNPLLIILGTPFLVRVWARRAAPQGTAHLMRRMSLGCLLAGAAMLVMTTAATVQAASGQPVSSAWVLGYLALLTLGEMMVIPVGLTLVATLAPARFAAMAMGAWYIAKFVGSLAAGIMGTWWMTVPHAAFFAASATSVFGAAMLLRLIARAGT